MSTFVSPETLNVEGQVETNLTVSLSVLLYFSTQKLNKLPTNYLLDVSWHTNLQQFQGAQPDPV